MKNTWLMLVAVCCFAAAQAQDASKVFSSTNVVWYGVDFTLAKMVGMKDESPHKIRDEYFKPWCDVANNDQELLHRALQKKGVIIDALGVFKANLARPTDNMMADDVKDLTPDAIAERVKGISVGQKKEGLAAVVIIQSLNKTTSEATGWAVFFDIATHKVLLAKKVTGKASGGNVKTAFTAGVKDIFTQMEKKEYAAWKKEANF